MTKDSDDYDPNRELKDKAEASHHGGTAVEQALGSNPLAAAAGAVAGMAVGAVGGLAAGPVGSAFGAAAGAVLGAMAGGAADTSAGAPLTDDPAWHEHHVRLPEQDRPRYMDLEPAYRIGDAAGDGDWDEARLTRLWDEGGSPLPWAHARPAARHAWELARERRGTSASAEAAPPAQPDADYQPRQEAS
jgi:hypothetical protein